MFAGLPELTAYYLLNEGLEPETLFRHCKPPNREGLITQPPKSGKGGGPGFVKGSEDSREGVIVQPAMVRRRWGPRDSCGVWGL